MLTKLDKNRPELPEDTQEQVNINLKYEGYIRRQKQQVAQFKKLEKRKLDVHWTGVQNLWRVSGRYFGTAGLFGADKISS